MGLFCFTFIAGWDLVTQKPGGAKLKLLCIRFFETQFRKGDFFFFFNHLEPPCLAYPNITGNQLTISKMNSGAIKTPSYFCLSEFLESPHKLVIDISQTHSSLSKTSL